MGTVVVIDGWDEVTQAVSSDSVEATVKPESIITTGDTESIVSDDAEGEILLCDDGECGIIMTVERGERETYRGNYTVTPAMEAQVLETKDKVMTDDVTVLEIPMYETTNLSGGTTLYIAMGE